MDISQRDRCGHAATGPQDKQGLRRTTADDWAFLQPWIDVLEGRLTTYSSGECDRVRVGVDSTDDVWLQVALVREEQLQVHQDGEQAGLSLLREAIMMIHLLGISNYELWYKWLVVDTQIYTPPQWFIPENSTIPMRYAFMFTEEHDESFMDWDQSLRFLLGDASCSDEFRRDFLVAKRLLARHSVDWEELQPLSVKLVFRSDDFGDIDIHLNCLTRAVMEIETLLAKTRQSPGEGSSVRLKVTEFDLDLAKETMTPPSFRALDQLLRLGVPVGWLSLPRLPFNAIQEERLASLKDVVGFFRTILGLTADRGRPLTQVQRLTMPLYYGRTRWFAAFCSALASSRFLRVLRLAPNATTGLAAVGFGPVGDARRRAWSWLSFALFSSASSTSVQELVLSGTSLLDSDIDAIMTVVESRDPIAQLDQLPHNQVRSGILANRFLAHRRAKLESRQLDTKTNKRALAQVSAISSFTDDWNQQVKKQRVGASNSSSSASSAFHTLQLMEESNDLDPLAVNAVSNSPIDRLLRLLRLVGTRLRGLAITSRSLNDEYLREICSLCPRLKSLAIRAGTLNSLEGIYEVYHRSDLALSSLKLSGVSIPFGALFMFVTRLEQSSRMEATLTRLQVDVTSHYVMASALINRMLRSNKTLTHLHLNLPPELHVHHSQQIQEKHGQVMTAVPEVERRRRLAFLGVQWRLAQLNPSVEMDGDLKALVLQFATPLPQRRCVTIGTLPTSN